MKISVFESLSNAHLLLGFAAIVLLAGSRLRRKAWAVLTPLLLTAAASAFAPFSANAADVDERRWSVTLTSHMSELVPQVHDSAWQLEDDTQLGLKVSADYRFASGWMVEAGYAQLGGAVVNIIGDHGTDHSVDYTAASAFAGRWLLDASSRANVLLKAGVASIDYRAAAHVPATGVEGTEFAWGTVVRLKLENNYHFQVDFERYHSTVARFGLGFGKRF